MKRTSLSLIALVALAIMAIALTGCGSRKTIVKVNGEKVSRGDFYNRLQAVPVQTPQGPQMAGRYVMQQIVTEKLVQQLAKKEGVPPTEAQINKKIDYIKKESGANLSKVLASRGMNMEDLKRQVGIEQAFTNVVTKGITIADADVRKAYDDAMKANPSPFVRPEAVMVSGIIVKDKARADKAYNLLASGNEFTTVAAEYNDDPGLRKSQGRLNWVSKQDTRLPAQITSTAFALPRGKYSKPFQVQGSWVILRSEAKRPKRITPFSEVKDIIKEQLAVREGTQKGYFTKQMQAFAKKADISINHPAYKDIPEQIKKQAATSAPTPVVRGGTETTQPAQPR